MRPQQTHENVVTLTDLDSIETIRSTWEQMQTEEPSLALNPEIDRYIVCLDTNKGSPCLPREATREGGAPSGAASI